MRRIKFVAQKEIYHILRDMRSLLIAFAMPILMAFLYGYAINMDIENVTIAVVDFDKTSESQELIDRFYKSTYFSMADEPVDLANPEHILRSGEATAILYITPGYGEALTKGSEFELGMTVDGADASLALAVQAYSNALLAEVMRDRLPEGMEIPGVAISQQILYNPDLESAHFFVPGLVAIILMLISALLTSITIAREKETGTMEQLLTAPVKPHEILIGKLLPYIAVAFLDGIFVLLFAWLVFDVPFVGSEVLMLGFGLVYVTTALSIGILISAISKTQQIAMMLAMTTTLLPSVMLSGFIFAVKNMPGLLQAISTIIPATYFVKIIRGIMLKGAGLEVMAIQGGGLVGLMLLFMFIAARRFSTRIG